MGDKEIFEALTEIFHDLFDDDSVVLRPETSAADIPEWDSFNHINLVVAIEQRFGIKFRTAEVEALHNVGEMVELIEHRRAEREQ